MIAPAAAEDLAPSLEHCFLFDATESCYEISGISGRVPAWIRGTWYVNGPARFERAGTRYKHWLDGDGMVCALNFDDDFIRFTSRFVQTRKLTEEQAAGRFLYRGFGTRFTGDRLRRNVMLEPPVNVSVYPYAGRLFAFGEQTLPYELDPVTLETVGEFDFGGKLNDVTPFAAHAKCDNGLLNFGVSFSAKQPILNVYEFDAHGGLNRRRRYPLSYPHSIHDFGFTPQHVVFLLSPLLLKFERFWNEGASIMESLIWEPEVGSRILVAPRGTTSGEPFTLEAGEGYCLHVINCHERGRYISLDVLLLDAPVYPEYQPIPDLFSTVPRGRPVRYVIDFEKRTLAEKQSLNYALAPDFPSVDQTFAGRDYRDFWMLGMSNCGRCGRKFFDQLVHANWQNGAADIYQAVCGKYLAGEPSFIRNPAQPEDAVVLVEELHPSEHGSAILIFDAFVVSKGPLAKLPLQYAVHPGFHTAFVPC
jgi:all-trans-8'-apo-beta-carotenal 15,15'-oxygenase